MKKPIFSLCLLCIIFAHYNSFAALKTVSINWTQSGTAEIHGYRMYYAYDSNMSNKILACETGQTNITSLTCTDVNLEQSPVYFVIAAQTTAGETNSSVVSKTFVSSISVVKDFTLSIPPDSTPPPAPTASYAINFQPAGAPVPDGFTADSGEAYDRGRGYGWTISPGTEGTRDRDNATSPDQSYDTLILADASGKWEFELANGTYMVTICVGDPWWAYSTNIIQLEGIQVINDTVSSEQKWIEKTGTVSVNDGRLTVTFQGSTPHSQLCWIKISLQQEG